MSEPRLIDVFGKSVVITSAACGIGGAPPSEWCARARASS